MSGLFMYVGTGGISRGIDRLLYSKSGGRHNMYILKMGLQGRNLLVAFMAAE